MTKKILTYGDGSTELVDRALGNFIGSSLNGLSLCCTPIELLTNDGSDKVVGHGSGFFWLQSGQAYLITNWHLVSGRDPFTMEMLSNNGFIPRKLKFYGPRLLIQGKTVEFVRQAFALSWHEEMEEILSVPPTSDEESVDLWASPLPDGIVFGKDASRSGFRGASDASCFLNENIGQPIVTGAGDMCFILGYPLRNYAGVMPPIWKRGTIASETNLGFGNRPMFLVDASTTKGMSGSPIVRKVTLVTADNRDIGALQEFSSYDFIGIYAGHLDSSMAALNLGFGWYRTLIADVIKHYNYSPLGIGRI